MEERSQADLDSYLNTLTADVASQYTSFSADYYCADEYYANRFAQLIITG